MRKNYTQVMWGIIFVFFNIKLGTFDILPDFLGYILIAAGLSGLAQINSIYRNGCIPAAILSVVSIIDMFFPINLARENISPSNLWLLGIASIHYVLNLIIFYAICKGVYSEAEIQGNPDIMQSARTRWNWMFYCTAISMFLNPFILTMKDWLMAAYFIFSVVLIIQAVLIAALLRTVRNEINKDIEHNINI